MRLSPLPIILAGLLAGCAAQPAAAPAAAVPAGQIPSAPADPSVMTPGGY